MIKWFHKYGDLYKFDIMGTTTVVLGRPELSERLFRHDDEYPNRPPLRAAIMAYQRKDVDKNMASYDLTDIHERGRWRDDRRLIDPVFLRPQSFKDYIPGISQVTKDFGACIERELQDDGTLENVEVMISRFTTEAIGTVCFGIRLGMLDESNEEQKEMHKLFNDTVYKFFSASHALQTGHLTARLPYVGRYNPVYQNYIKCYAIVEAKANTVIGEKLKRAKAERKDLPKEFIDYLDFLIKNSVEDKQSLRLAGTMFIGGIDTTAKSLTWVFYCLAKHPEVVEKIYAEIVEAQEGKGVDEALTNDQIQRLPYLRAAVKECNRVWPAVIGTNRLLEKDIELGGYRIPAGVVIHPSTWIIGKNPAVHKDPLAFRPERWLEGKHNPFGLLLFGHGPRMCPGRRIAEAELHLATAELCRRFKLSSDQDVDGVLLTMVQPDRPLKIKFEKRQRK